MIEMPPNRLREFREKKGLARRDLAVAIDVTEDTIRRLEENRGGPIPSKYIPTLAALLETTPEHLMGWDRNSSMEAAA